MKIILERRVRTAVTPSQRVRRVAAMFGLGLDPRRTIGLIPLTELDLRPGQVVFITGPSGGGKSMLLSLIAERVTGAKVIRFDRLPEPPDRPLVDCFGDLPLTDVLRVLSRAGLNDAFVMLRRPGELSDGQRYRLRLAQMFVCVEGKAEQAPPLNVVLADEFGAALDRVTAKVIARNVRKWVTRCDAPVCFVAATTHDDLLEALDPDVLIEKQLGQGIEVVTR